MLNTSAIATALAGLVGWRDPAGALPAALTTSRSGLYVQDQNELLTLDVLQHVVPKGEALPAWLLRVQQAALLALVPRLAAAQGLDGRVVLPDTKLIKNPGRRTDTVNKLGRFVGLELRFTRFLGVSYALPSVSLQLDGVLTEPLTLYLFSATQADPIATYTVPAGKPAYYPIVVPLTEGNDLSFAAADGNAAYLGYYENDLPLTVHAIGANVGPCGCPDDPFAVWSQYVTARPFATTPPMTLESYDYGQLPYQSESFGLNLTMQGYCDVATALQSQDNQARLAPAVLLAYACRFLEAIVSSPNVTNLTGRQDVQADAYALLTKYQAQLFGGKDISTQSDYYPSTLGKLTLDLSGLDSICQQQNKYGVSMGTLTR